MLRSGVKNYGTFKSKRLGVCERATLWEVTSLQAWTVSNAPEFLMQRLLVICDSKSRLRDDTDRLQNFGFEVHSANGSLPDDLNAFDLLLLDCQAAPTTVTDTVRAIRGKSALPLMVLSSARGETECVLALELGADDFVRNPISDLELSARIKALIRRSRTTTTLPPAVLIQGDLELQVDARIVRRSGVTLELTPTEFDILKLLMSSAGTLVTRDTISLGVFHRKSSRNRAVDVHMSGLRKKLGPRRDGSVRIRTIRGYGFVFDTDH